MEERDDNLLNEREDALMIDADDQTGPPERSEETAAADTADAQRCVSTSEPYRYKFERGEQSERLTQQDASSVCNSCYSDYYSSGAYARSAEPGAAASTLYPTPKKRRPFLKALKFVAAAACFGVIAGGAFYGTSLLLDKAFGTEVASSPDPADGSAGEAGFLKAGLGVTVTQTAPNETAVEDEEDSVVVKVVEENMAASVAIKSTFVKTYRYFGQTYEQEATGGGSGIIVGKNDTELLIATNNHVIEDAKKIEITFIDDTVLEATVKGNDTIADLAIVAVPLSSFTEDTLSKIHIAVLGNSDAVKVGEMAIAIGNALGYGQSVTVGYVSAKDRTVNVDGKEMVLLQTDAAINQGNSGGGLFNTKGEVIGINSVKYSDTSVEGMCFAIPISRAIPILNELMNRETLSAEEQGYLGVEIKNVTEEIASFYGWPIGVYISSVVENGAAAKAGIYVGDIITAVNGVQVSTMEQLKSAVNSYRYGTTIEVVLQRNVNGAFETITLPVTLMKNPNL